MQRLILKSLYVVALLKYPKIRKDLRYFIRDNYYCKLVQGRFLLRDYVLKEKYKVISYQGEFDQEVRYVLPFAYWHYLNGTLKKTISAKGTADFYFFSPEHEERFQKRIWTESYTHYDVPNMTHSYTYSFRNWAQVPYKAHYQNDVFVFDKPLLVIANKYNIEWDQPPINFLDIPSLERIIRTYGSRYQLIYNRPLPSQIVEDNSETMSLHEHSWLRETYPEVILMDDLYAKYHPSVVRNYNHLQLMVYANCNHFISMHGGTAALASCFGGTNIILSDPNWGFEHAFNEYETLFPKLSGATILHARKREEIFTFLSTHF
ncbi:hypothetical protein EXU85_14385 [Spirosoma sp. KCTC 42546]|uniref:hypothetical protein n=1 Tax=Spirosoma sp. KCTC 42546 TaxID=2520506 RepID=UPI00115BA1DF|nr:hypothetical protein [Spirosoma sp. KCTC 42546]QDK79732.1 hypothetical protein EXU85_14385 [Spirosoma sp. KCTC 42546]